MQEATTGRTMYLVRLHATGQLLDRKKTRQLFSNVVHWAMSSCVTVTR